MLTAYVSVGEFNLFLKFRWITEEDDNPEDGRENNRMSSLCHDLLLDILSRLPLVDVIRCRCVSKEWHTLISTVLFPKMSKEEPVIGLYFTYSYYRDLQYELSSEGLGRSHRSHSPRFTNLEAYNNFHNRPRDKEVCKDYRFRGTSFLTLVPFYWLRTTYLLDCCNGLLLFAHPLRPIYYVCNPVTKQCVPIPAPRPRTCLSPPSVFSVLAFDPSESCNYRVVLLSVESDLQCLNVFYSHLGKWRTYQLEHPQASQLLKQPFYWKGVVYGLSVSNNLLCFDLEAMKLSVVVPPDKEIPFGKGCAGVLNGRLCYAIRDTLCLRIWSLEKTNEHGKWCLDYNISNNNLYDSAEAHLRFGDPEYFRCCVSPHPLDPYCFDPKSERIFVGGPMALGMYDIQGRNFRLLHNGHFHSVTLFPVFPYSRTFVTLENIGVEGDDEL